MAYVADFETTTKVEDCRVWAWGITIVGNDTHFEYGNTIDGFLQWLGWHDGAKVYFHNQKFDGEFLLAKFFELGYKHTQRRTIKPGEIKTLIGDMGQFYSMDVCLFTGQKITFWDSLKLIPLSVEEIPEAFGLDVQKGKIDYDAEREEGHELTDDELLYLRRDVCIVAKALKIMFAEGLKRMTQAGNALAEYKQIVGKKFFDRNFPVCKNDSYIRKAYRGGFTYLNPVWADIDILCVYVFDVNSLYPSVMYDKPMPYGEGKYFKGKYNPDEFYNLYVQRLRCAFELKPNKIPTLQLKNNLKFCATEYLESSNNEFIELTLTSVDLKLFFDQYEVFEVEYIDGFMYRSRTDMFKSYIDKWMTIKIEAGKQGNKGLRQIAKLMLNSLYGRFAITPECRGKEPYLDENGVVKYRLTPKQQRKALYIPVGAFITAYAREKTIRTSQAIKDYSFEKYGVDMYIYSDTDSIHTTLNPEECKQFMEIDDYKLGAWKHESTATKGRFIRAKTYLEFEIKKEVPGMKWIHKKVTCAGMPKKCYNCVTWENFHPGLTVDGKLVPKHVKGGIVLSNTTFEIKHLTKKKIK